MDQTLNRSDQHARNDSLLGYSRMIKRPIFILLFLLAAGVWQAAEAECDLDYGLYLFRRGNYGASIMELERYIYHNPDEHRTPYARLVLALAYANEERYGSALLLLEEVQRSVEYSPFKERYSRLSCESSFHTLSILFRQRRENDFLVERGRIDALCPDIDSSLQRYTDSMAVSLSIYNLDWENALQELDKSLAIPSDTAGLLRAELEKTIGHRAKSPVLGGFLSIVPGIGHIYAGRPWDGLKSLLINATFVTLSVVCFTNDIDAAGWVFAGVEGVLYVANIYGGVNAVLQENARWQVSRRNEMLKLLPAPPLNIITVREEFESP